MEEIIVRRVWVRSRGELYTYLRITVGSPEDQSLAYDLRITPCSTPPPDIEIIEDLVALDIVRAQLGLMRPNLLTKAFNALWSKAGADTVPLVKNEGSLARVYRIGHPKRPKGFF